MTGERQGLIKYRLQRAYETLEEASTLIQAGKFQGVPNRVYYAMFYAVSALLLSKNLSSSKHSGVKSLFNREFIKPGLIPTNWGKIYEDAFRDRQEGDYLDYIEFSLAEVKEMQKQGQEFVAVISRFLRQNQTTK